MSKFNSSPVKQFLENKKIFITGGFGSVGKLLIEKLLKCHVDKIFMLARPKKGKTIQERFEVFIQDPAFTHVRNDFPEAFSKISLINGDLREIRLGISDENYAILLNEVDIVFHSAADVRFDESLKDSIQTNVRGTREIMNLSREIPQLKVFVYISTCFVALEEQVKEKVYPTDYDPEEMISLVESFKGENSDHFEVLGPRIIQNFPNTYTFSKALAEQLVMKYSSDMNIAIVRPSIISTAHREPVEGYTDSVYGVNGICMGAGYGILRIFQIDNSIKAAIIPADYVNNAILAITWFTALKNNFKPKVDNNENVNLISEQENDEEKTKIYHITSSDENPYTWGDMKKFLTPIARNMPIKNAVWIMTYNTTRYAIVAYILSLFYHLIPAFFMDQILKLRKEKPKISLMRLYRKVTLFSHVITFFTNRSWSFETKNLDEVIQTMSKEDQKEFYCDARLINWPDFMISFGNGLRLYLAKEELDTLTDGLKLHKTREKIHFFMMSLIYSFMAFMFYKISSFYGLFNFLSNFAGEFEEKNYKNLFTSL